MGVGVLGIGHYAPDKIVTNKDLEKIVDTTDEWIRSRTGIEERRIASDEEDSSDMAYKASLTALNNANIAAEEIDLIVVATVTPDTPFPSVACMIQERLGAVNAAAMDVGAACAGFMYAMITGQQFIEAGAYKNVLIVGVDKLSKNYRLEGSQHMYCLVMVQVQLFLARSLTEKVFFPLNLAQMEPVENICIRMSSNTCV